MNNIEELFKKVNKEKILIEGHKAGLKNYLLNTEYFNEKKAFDYRLAFSATLFSLLIISVSFLFFGNNNEEELASKNYQRVSEIQPVQPAGYANESMKMVNVSSDALIEESSQNLYDKLMAKDDVETYDSVFDEKEVKVIEVSENNIKTRYYFNKDKNILIKTEIINNK